MKVTKNVLVFQADVKLPLKFRSLPEGQTEVNMGDYKQVFSGDIEVKEKNSLEDIFYIFNMRHPESFTGHSLSVSDIVMIDGNYYYCNDLGWKQVWPKIN